MSMIGRIPLLFLLFWSALTLLFDGVIVHGITRQLLALSYAETTGTITASKVTESSDGDGSTYGFEVRYTYEVNGQKYVGDRYRYSQWRASNSSTVREVAQRHRKGTTVPVFYASDEPEEAVLLRGIQGFDLFMLLFMTPFNLVMIGGWYGRVRGRKQEDDLVGAFTRGGRLHVRLEKTGVVDIGLKTAGLCSFVAVFVVGIPTGFNPSLPTILLTWGALIVLSVFSAWKHGAKLEAGEYDVIVDQETRRLSLPVGANRKERLDVPWNQVSSISVEPHTTKDSEGNSHTSWRPTVVLNAPDGVQRSEVLVGWNDEVRATALVEWLKARLRHREPSGTARGRANA